MLKIKDEIDLKELEKFGFEEEEFKCVSGYYYYVTEEVCARIVMCEPNAITSLRKYQVDREIYFDYSHLSDDEEFRQKLEDYEHILFDLIQAGLVEKVEK